MGELTLIGDNDTMNHDTLFLPDNPFAHLDAIRAHEQPWGFLDDLKSYLLDRTVGDDEGVDQLEGYGTVETVRRPDGSLCEVALIMTRTLILSEPFRISGIVIGKGTMLEAGAIVKAPTLSSATIARSAKAPTSEATPSSATGWW